MHGTILKGFTDFIVERYDRTTWDEVRAHSGVDGGIYLPVKTYPDGEFAALADAAGTVTDAERDTLLEEFGEWVVPDLLETYSRAIDDEWSVFDVIERTADHYAGPMTDGGADEPLLECDRVSDTEVRITYSSGHHLCSLGKGLARGVAQRLDEPMTITESSCQLDGADRCAVVVTR